MAELDLTGLLIVVAVAFLAPLLLGLAPSLRLPSVVLELVAGIVIGPSVLGWVEVDEPIRVLALIGLAFLLFLAGLEIEFDRLRGRRLMLVLVGFAASFGIAVVVGFGLQAVGRVDDGLFVAIVLVATSLGVVVPVLKDSGKLGSDLGQLVVAAASVADFGAVILLSLFFSRESASLGSQLVLLGGFALATLVALAVLMGLGRSMVFTPVLERLQDTTAQIRVRGAFLLLVGFSALAVGLGLEVILGAFLAGAVLTLCDRDRRMTHPDFRRKLEAAGYGMFIPVFFVTSGVLFDLDALFASGSTVALVPLFLAAILLVRGLPALVYRSALGRVETVVAGLLQATTLPFIVAAVMIGTDLGALDEATGAALIAAGLLSVLVFPLLALTLLRRTETAVTVAGPQRLKPTTN
ncbi:MAG TPA: cation:proton antiporter [Gaiellaceae bacterium]|nr:cation:proton antiporter [Gaiellaceae bacterium]